VPRKLVPPLTPGWVIVDGLPVFQRSCLDAGSDADAMVHVHGFGISGTFLEPTAALLAGVPGAHALNNSDPRLIAELIEAHIAGEPLVTQTGPRSVAAAVSVDGS
jgi:hypothetical protein